MISLTPAFSKIRIPPVLVSFRNHSGASQDPASYPGSQAFRACAKLAELLRSNRSSHISRKRKQIRHSDYRTLKQYAKVANELNVRGAHIFEIQVVITGQLGRIPSACRHAEIMPCIKTWQYMATAQISLASHGFMWPGLIAPTNCRSFQASPSPRRLQEAANFRH